MSKSSSSSDNSIDIIVASPHESFWQQVSETLKVYESYNLKWFNSIDSIMEHSDPMFSPILSIIDSFGGTNACAEWVQSTKMTFEKTHILIAYSSEHPVDFSVLKKNGADAMLHFSYDKEFFEDIVIKFAPLDLQKNIPLSALTQISHKEIEPESELNFDMVIHIPSSHKSVVMRKKGTVIDKDTLDRFEKTPSQLYIKKSEQKQFFEYSRTVQSMRNLDNPTTITEKFYKSKQIICELISQFLNLEATDFKTGKEIFERAKEIIQEFELLNTYTPKEAWEKVCTFTGIQRTIYHDAINVCAYSALFGSLLGVKPDKRESLALAGLFHNIGLSQLPSTAINKKIEDLLPEEMEIYQKYPLNSVNMVKNKKVPIPQDVTRAMEEHRRHTDGSGFPKEMTSEIYELAKIIRLALRFQELTALVDGKARYKPKEALEFLRDEVVSQKSIHDVTHITTLLRNALT